MDQAPELKRSLFGYRTKDVESILEQRELMFERLTDESDKRKQETDRVRADLGKVREEARKAHDETDAVRTELTTQLDDLRGELESLRADVTRLEDQRRDAETRATGLEAELRDARREVSGLSERLRVADATEEDLRTRLDEAATATGSAPQAQELGAVLEATQEAIGRIMADARRNAEEDLARVQRTRDELQADVDRVRTWRDRLEPVTRDIAGEIAMAQAQMSQTAERVGEALRPMSDALTALSNGLGVLASVADPDTMSGERPDRVDLVSHERTSGESDRVDSEAPTGAASHTDPWPDPWR
jgi:chromosome segregation ATPase